MTGGHYNAYPQSYKFLNFRPTFSQLILHLKCCTIVILHKRAVRAVAKIQYGESTDNAFNEIKILKVQKINKPEIYI